MKRRSLLTGSFLSSILAFVSPVRAALVPNSNNQHNDQHKPMSPYEAVKAVYDGFVSPRPDTEFVFDEPYVLRKEGCYDKVFCKLISLAGATNKHHDVWLIFNDSYQVFPNFKKLARTLIVAQVVTQEVHDLQSQLHPQETYNVEEIFKSSWRQSGRHIVVLNEFHHPNSINQSFETGSIFTTNSRHIGDTHICALARFLSLIS